MSELYWLGVLGNLHDLCVVTAVICFFVFVVLCVWVVDNSEEESPFLKKY